MSTRGELWSNSTGPLVQCPRPVATSKEAFWAMLFRDRYRWSEYPIDVQPGRSPATAARAGLKFRSGHYVIRSPMAGPCFKRDMVTPSHESLNPSQGAQHSHRVECA